MFRSFLRNYSTLLLVAPALIALIVVRMVWTGTLHFGFLGWNIFLALLPLLFSHLVVSTQCQFIRYCCAALWLLFLPNASYLLTDLVHLKAISGSLFWLDLAILFAAGLYGVILSLISVRIMENWYGAMIPKSLVPATSLILLMLCGYGMYLGRVERWNSWDIITDPLGLLGTMMHEIRHPFQFKEVWAMSGLFGGILSLFYFLQRRLSLRLN